MDILSTNHPILQENYLALISKSITAKDNSYSPYSGFRVGAALLSSDGRIFTGSNVESASYSLTLCAERVVFSKAVSEGVRSFTAIAISTDSEELVYPCGACRQFMNEFSGDLDVIIVNSKNNCEMSKLSELLPKAFSGSSLPEK